MNPWLLAKLVCPADRTPLARDGDRLNGACGHEYSIVEGVPVLLRPDTEPTHEYLSETLDAVERWRAGEPLEWDEDQGDPDEPKDAVDGWVQQEIVRTCGSLYLGVHGKLPRYPIPELRLPEGRGQRFLDVGCNWGRWTISAARAGYRPVGIDPSLRALLAARRVANQLGVECSFVAADARHLPFADDAFDRGFSYSVLQHFPQQAMEAALTEMARVVDPSGSCLVQMANRYGLRQMYASLRQRMAGKRRFSVRRYSPRQLRAIFERRIGATEAEVDGYFSLNVQPADLDLLPPRAQLVVNSSERLRKLSRRVPGLTQLADSLYLKASPRA